MFFQQFWTPKCSDGVGFHHNAQCQKQFVFTSVSFSGTLLISAQCVVFVFRTLRGGNICSWRAPLLDIWSTVSTYLKNECHYVRIRHTKMNNVWWSAKSQKCSDGVGFHHISRLHVFDAYTACLHHPSMTCMQISTPSNFTRNNRKSINFDFWMFSATVCLLYVCYSL